MDQLLPSLAIGAGACAGSALRHALDSNGLPIRALSPLTRLVMTAVGSFIAGLLTAELFAADAAIPAGEFRRNATMILIGVLGGFVTFPGPASVGNAEASGKTSVGLFRLVGSLMVAIGFFITGARSLSAFAQ